MASIIEDQLSWALSRIIELEELLADANDRVQRLIEGDPVSWEEIDLL